MQLNNLADPANPLSPISPLNPASPLHPSNSASQHSIGVDPNKCDKCGSKIENNSNDVAVIVCVFLTCCLVVTLMFFAFVIETYRGHLNEK